MAKLINASIDLAKIDKSKIVTTDKNGQPFANGAKYLNISIWINDQPDQYGNIASISINQTKEEREAGQKKIYIGNGKDVQPKTDPIPAAAASAAPAAIGGPDDLPF